MRKGQGTYPLSFVTQIFRNVNQVIITIQLQLNYLYADNVCIGVKTWIWLQQMWERQHKLSQNP